MINQRLILSWGHRSFPGATPPKNDGLEITFLLGFGNLSGTNCSTSGGYNELIPKITPTI